jgi:hypothetical protein
VAEAQRLNADAHAGRLNGAALQQTLRAPGHDWYGQVTERCPHLFADVSVFISRAQLQQMTDVIAAVERVVNSERWIIDNGQLGVRIADCGMRNAEHVAKGVFYGYDFHLNAEGAHLIEINTNAGGAFLNALLIDSQRDANLPGEAAALTGLEKAFTDMFRSEWKLMRADAPLACIAIVDQNPEQQYLYPEFVLAQRLFERAGVRACIADPSEFMARDDGLYVGEQKIDLVYNRLTDFSLQQHPVLLNAYLAGQVVLTPNPAHYARYADKRNLARLTDADGLRKNGVTEADINTLQAGIPHTFVVQPELESGLWDSRKSLFFKPYFGYGSKGAYRGEKLTRRVFGEILQSGYIAQKMKAPGERSVGDEQTLKYDVRCYVYNGKIQLVAARLYQGQTTNFRTPGGGFAQVRVVG